jgi:tetraacyldisaccharide 4'-kinase
VWVFFEYISSVMSGSARGVAASFTAAVLRVFSVVYAAGVKLVWFGYSSGLRKVYSAPIPVVSVGNLTLGGTGKTPMVIFTANYFLSLGKKTAVITRGYGNDECRMLEEELPQALVYRGQDRVKSAFSASEDGCDAAILDDGFQHRRIKRDLNILLVDGRNLFGNGRIFPAGMLREPVKAAGRADVMVITKADGIGQRTLNEIKEYLACVAPGVPLAVSRHEPISFTDVDGRVYGIDSVKNLEIFAVSGIADPEYFESMLKHFGGKITEKRFYQDHHKYSQRDLDDIAAICERRKIEALVTTGKDLVKMKDLDMSRIRDRVRILNVRMNIVEGKDLLIAGLNSVVSCSGT